MNFVIRFVLACLVILIFNYFSLLFDLSVIKNLLVFSHHFWLLCLVENGKVFCLMRAK